MGFANLFKNSAKPLESVGNIRIMGDRSAGKTAYIASLAYWPNANPATPVQSVTPLGDQDAGAFLIDIARNVLEEGLTLAPTDLEDVFSIKDYRLSIVLKDRYSLGQLGSGLIKLNINCKDYSGELFRDLIHKANDQRLQEYIEDCLVAEGILLLIDGTAYRLDAQYADGLEKFLKILERSDLGKRKRRIAVTLNKCDQPQLWVSRHQPRELAARRFPLMVKKLEYWSNGGGGGVDYFTASAFGMMGNIDPEPNSKIIKRDKSGTTCVIKEPKLWRPFGLVSPIYWLCTGQRHQDLDRD
ncbi:MAG: hypothetical protein N5P05_002676 [Chroococcopsis gigantea SAG 12.99]|nr:hypothetical protein [Chlorogloea purpurea SAG 13.99]MDV3001070.1 hypothetical protein [Chroococcopsis gigantea SAG 12.99]